MDPVSAPDAGKLLSGGPRRVFSANLCRPRSLLLLLLVSGGTEEVGDLALAPAVSSAMRARPTESEKEEGEGRPSPPPLSLSPRPRRSPSELSFYL